MGNCLKSPTADDVSLLRDTAHHSHSTEQMEPSPPPPLPLASASTGATSHPYGDGGPAEPSPSSSGAAPTVFYPSPNVSRPANQLTEEEQVRIAQRMGLIQHLPTGHYDGTHQKNKECVICMVDFCQNDRIRYLPCMHTYHTDCIDDWLMRSFTCPSCMEPVDAALLITYETH